MVVVVVVQIWDGDFNLTMVRNAKPDLFWCAPRYEIEICKRRAKVAPSTGSPSPRFFFAWSSGEGRCTEINQAGGGGGGGEEEEEKDGMPLARCSCGMEQGDGMGDRSRRRGREGSTFPAPRPV